MERRPTDRSLDEDLAELLAISQRLPDATATEKIDLIERQRELRGRWSSQYATLTTDRLLELRRALHAQRDELFDRRFDIAATGNGSGFGGGLDPLATMQHNRKVDEWHGRDDLERELAAVEAELRSRGVTPDDLD